MSSRKWFCGVVVITSALHAEGPRFDPGQNQATFFPNKFNNYVIKICSVTYKFILFNEYFDYRNGYTLFNENRRNQKGYVFFNEYLDNQKSQEMAILFIKIFIKCMNFVYQGME